MLGGVDAFYANVLGDLKAWSAAPPKLRPAAPSDGTEREPGTAASLSSTDFSSQDGAEPAPDPESPALT